MNSNIYQVPKADLTPPFSAKSHNETITTMMVDALVRAAQWGKWLAIVIYLVVVCSILGVGFLVNEWFTRSSAFLQHLTLWHSIALLVFYLFFTGVLISLGRILQQYALAVGVLSDSYSDFDLVEVQSYFDGAVQRLGALLVMILVTSIVALIIGFI